jgi:hypothetical protein
LDLVHVQVCVRVRVLAVFALLRTDGRVKGLCVVVAVGEILLGSCGCRFVGGLYGSLLGVSIVEAVIVYDVFVSIVFVGEGVEVDGVGNIAIGKGCGRSRVGGGRGSCGDHGVDGINGVLERRHYKRCGCMDGRGRHRGQIGSGLQLCLWLRHQAGQVGVGKPEWAGSARNQCQESQLGEGDEDSRLKGLRDARGDKSNTDGRG